MMKKIVLVYCSRKGGHKFPAESVGSYIESRYKKSIEATLVNLLDHIPSMSFLDRIGRWGDLKLPGLWRRGYSDLHEGASTYTDIYRRMVTLALANSDSRARIIKALGNPDLILSLQPEVNCIASYLRRWFEVPIHTVVMDYSAHIGWIHEAISQYYVSNSHVMEQLTKWGVAQERIEVTGAPSQRGFDEVMRCSIEEQRRKLDIKEDIPTILVMSGFLGKMIDYVGIIKGISKINIPHQLLVVYGKNEAMYNICKDMKDEDTHLYLNLPNIHPVMWASDIIISKPGGMVIADALALGKPMILIDPIAGSLQEIIFAELVSKQGVGLHLKDSSEVEDTLRDLLSNKDRLRDISKKAKELGLKNRNAARSIAKKIMHTVEIAC